VHRVGAGSSNEPGQHSDLPGQRNCASAPLRALFFFAFCLSSLFLLDFPSSFVRSAFKEALSLSFSFPFFLTRISLLVTPPTAAAPLSLLPLPVHLSTFAISTNQKKRGHCQNHTFPPDVVRQVQAFDPSREHKGQLHRRGSSGRFLYRKNCILSRSITSLNA